jgi:hypothetical protein
MRKELPRTSVFEIFRKILIFDPKVSTPFKFRSSITRSRAHLASIAEQDGDYEVNTRSAVQTTPFEYDEAETIQIQDNSPTSCQLHQSSCNLAQKDKTMISSAEESSSNEAVNENVETCQTPVDSGTSCSNPQPKCFSINEQKVIKKSLISSAEERTTSESVDKVRIPTDTQDMDAHHVLDGTVSPDATEDEAEALAKKLMQYLQKRM